MKDALKNFVNVFMSKYVFRGKHADSVDIDPQQGSLITLMRKNWKTLYLIPLTMQEWAWVQAAEKENAPGPNDPKIDVTNLIIISA